MWSRAIFWSSLLLILNLQYCGLENIVDRVGCYEFEIKLAGLGELVITIIIAWLTMAL